MRYLIATGAALAVTLPAWAQDERPLEIADLFELQSVSSAEISPDGARVAYTVSTPRNVVEGEDDGTSMRELFIAGAANEGTRFIGSEHSIGSVGWHPAGHAVTFLSRRGDDDHTALYEIGLGGGEARRVFEHDAGISSYAFAADGTLYILAQEEADPMVEELADRGFRARVYEEDEEFTHVWRVGLHSEGGEATRLDLPGHASDMAIAPNGRMLAVTLAPTALVDDAMMSQRWHIVDAGDGSVEAVIETPGKTGGGVFSPDGESFAFLAAVDRADSIAGTLHIADVDSGDFTIIAGDAEQHVQAFDWTADGNLVALVHASTASGIVTYAPDGSEISRDMHDGIVAHSLSYSADSGRMAMVADAAEHPNELYVAEAGGAAQRWTTHNEWLDDIAFGEQRVIRYAARDGVEIEGVLITPRGRAPEGGWPLIMTVHGGPEGNDTNGWMTGYSRPGHIAAGRGMAVLYPNYRGSTGRGADFIRLDHADAPGDEFHDLLDGIDYLVEEGLVNRDKVGITGGSYGGFASAWGATIASEHFAASVPFVALTDLISFHGTTEIPVEMVDVHFVTNPWDDWQMYLEKSPSYNAAGSTTPTLIMHGEADTRVDPSQSFILYRYLKQTGDAPVRLVLYPGEGHGNRMAAAQFDYAHRQLNWLEHYLTGPGGEPPAADLDWETLLDLED
ncbi:S9 family peptidase [Maricaulis sp. CAU 1757]